MSREGLFRMIARWINPPLPGEKSLPPTKHKIDITPKQAAGVFFLLKHGVRVRNIKRITGIPDN